MAIADELSPRMYDHKGVLVLAWLPEMQSTEFLRQAIARSQRTAECWNELRQRRARRHVFQRLLPTFRAATAPLLP